MGAKTWMLVYSKGAAVPSVLKSRPELDRKGSTALAKTLFPSEMLKPIADESLSNTNPPDDEIVVGCFPGVSIVAAAEFGIDYPSQLPIEFREPNFGNTVYLHAMHSVVDWFAFAVWQNGSLQRSLSLSPDSGIMEDIGEKMQFELPYWAGEHPALDPDEDPDEYPFPFHPLDLGEAALAEFFGYHLEGPIDANLVDPEDIRLMCFKRSKPWWKVW
jgi:hypothetical protein